MALVAPSSGMRRETLEVNGRETLCDRRHPDSRQLFPLNHCPPSSCDDSQPGTSSSCHVASTRRLASTRRRLSSSLLAWRSTRHCRMSQEIGRGLSPRFSLDSQRHAAIAGRAGTDSGWSLNVKANSIFEASRWMRNIFSCCVSRLSNNRGEAC